MKTIDRRKSWDMTASRNNAGTAALTLYLCATAVAFLHGSQASAAWIDITPAAGQVILQINYAGTPTVMFTVPAALLGNGTAIAGTPALEFELSIRRTGVIIGTPLTATMTATAPAALFSGANQIPITAISWTSAAIAGAPGGTTLIPNGSFVAGPQTIVGITTPFIFGTTVYAGGALTFYFDNNTIYPQGTYGPATVNYTASRNP
ncbi:MAG TPA: hypothetical protein VEI74_11140 [Candidatus Methylomirabilis sp.]|nr:hypothetical protein [Candidatus Methylomirabilis sp.]